MPIYKEGLIMSSKKKKIQNAELENQRIIDSYDYLSNAASSQDCTGLIPSAPVSDSELESYEAIYKFQPPEIPSDNDTK